CAQDRRALGLVVSQDGHVRFIMTSGRSLVLWDNPKLLDRIDFSAAAVRRDKDFRDRPRRRRDSFHQFRLGYTDTPKTLNALMKATGRLASKKSRRTAIASPWSKARR